MKTARVAKTLAPELFRELLFSVAPEFPEVAIAPLYDAHQVQSYSPREFLMKQGETCRGVFLLWDGTAQLSLLDDTERRKPLEMRKIFSPAIIGVPGIVLGHCLIASARAVTQVEAAFIPRANFMQV